MSKGETEAQWAVTSSEDRRWGPGSLPLGSSAGGPKGPGAPVFEVGCRKTLAWDKTPQKSWQQARHYRHPSTKIRGAQASSSAFPYPECPFTDGHTEAILEAQSASAPATLQVGGEECGSQPLRHVEPGDSCQETQVIDGSSGLRHF